MLKKEYLYELIESMYLNKTERNLAITKLIKRLESSNNIETANAIRNIQMQNTSATKANVKESNK